MAIIAEAESVAGLDAGPDERIAELGPRPRLAVGELPLRCRRRRARSAASSIPQRSAVPAHGREHPGGP